MPQPPLNEASYGGRDAQELQYSDVKRRTEDKERGGQLRLVLPQQHVRVLGGGGAAGVLPEVARQKVRQLLGAAHAEQPWSSKLMLLCKLQV